MRVRSTAVILCGLAACGGGTTAQPDAGSGADARPGAAWWTPKPGDARNWDIQLAAPFDLSQPRTMYMLDLWDVVPAPTVIDYGDGAPITVPAGVLPTAIADLHARTPRTVVICHVNTGIWEAGRPDAQKFPGFEAAMPDDPVPPKPGSVIGWTTGLGEDRFLDLRASRRAYVGAVMWRRFDLAKQIGCDGVAPDWNDVGAYATGFPIDIADQNAWYGELALQGHARELSTGMKDANEIPGQVDDLAFAFDWLLVGRCGEYDDCDSVRPFVNLQKAALDVDYQLDGQGGGVDPTIACSRQMQGQVQDGIVKDADPPSSAFRVQCTP